MIAAHKPDVNPDDYCYDTGMTFGDDFGEKLLNEILTNPAQFTQRIKYNRGNTYKELVKEVGAVNARELNRRKLQFHQYNPNQKPISFLQWHVPKALDEEFYALVPKWLSELYPGEPKTIVQTSQNGEFLPTHMGHNRCSSMFMLLQGQEQETRWYRNTEPFEVISSYAIPDCDKIEHIVTAVMQPYRWYVFNHQAWHSVHNFAAGGVRVNMGLDFDHVPTTELVEAIKGRQYL
jgi:hypothetical protein